MDFNYNSNDVLLLNYNDNEVKNLYYNGTQVYQKRTLTLSLTYNFKQYESKYEHFVIPTIIVTVNGQDYTITQSNYAISVNSSGTAVCTATYSIPVVNNSSINIYFIGYTQLSIAEDHDLQYYQGTTYAGTFFYVYDDFGLHNVRLSGNNSDDTTISLVWTVGYTTIDGIGYTVITKLYYTPSTLTIENV